MAYGKGSSKLGSSKKTKIAGVDKVFPDAIKTRAS